MSSTINPHLVPQFYLRYFSSNRNAQLDRKLRRIYTFSKRRNREVYDDTRREGEAPRPPLISKVATAKEFYEPYGQGDVLEQRFNNLESTAKRAIDEILRTRSVNTLSPKQRLRFSEYISLQYYRTLKYRRFLEKEARVLIETIFTDPTSEASKAVFAQWDEVDDRVHRWKRASIEQKYVEANSLPEPDQSRALAEIDAERRAFEDFVIGFDESKKRDRGLVEGEDLRKGMREFYKDVRQYQNIIIERSSWALTKIVERAVWTLGVNTSLFTFLTSDSPVTIYPFGELLNNDWKLYHNYLLSEIGLVDFLERPQHYPAYVLYLPLSPEVILQINPFLRLQDRPGDELCMDLENVLEINHYQARQAHDEIFSTTDVFMERQVRQAKLSEDALRAKLNLWADD